MWIYLKSSKAREYQWRTHQLAELPKNEQNGRQNNVKISGFQIKIPDQDLEEIQHTWILKVVVTEQHHEMDNCQICKLKIFWGHASKKKNVNVKSKVFVPFTMPTLLWQKCKDIQRKGKISRVFCLCTVVTIRVTENSPAIMILHEKDLMVYQECPQESMWKIYFFSFVIVIVNFRLYSADS